MTIPFLRVRAAERLLLLAAAFAVSCTAKTLPSRRYRTILDRLRKVREEAGLTQTELARSLWRSQTWVSKCELGERRVD